MQNYLELIKKHTNLFLAFLIVLITVVLSLLLFKDTRVPVDVQTPIITQTPTIPDSKGSLTLLKTIPEEEKNNTGERYKPIGFVFSEVIKLDTAKVQISPEIKFNLKAYKETPNILWIEPVKAWTPRPRYTVTVSETLEATNGLKLTKPITFRFTNIPLDFIENPPF